MNLSQLHYFQVVAEEEHISRAAEKLHVSQPSLSTTIRRLETELGAPLFDRRGRNIYLNEAGRKLLEHVNFIFSQIDHLGKDLELRDLHIAHGLSMALNNTAYLDGWLSQFIRSHEKARISQSLLTEEQMIEALRTEKIDLAFGLFSEVPPEIEQHVLVEDEYMVSVPAGHPLTQKRTLCFDDIRDEPFAALPSNSVNCFIYSLFEQKNVQPNIVFEGNHNMMFTLFQRSHALIFSTRQLMYIQYHYASETDLASLQPGVYLLPLEDLDTHVNLSLCWKKDRALPAMAQTLRDALINDYPLYTSDDAFMQALPKLI